MYFSKMPVLSVQISLENYGKSLGGCGRISLRKSASSLALCSRRLVSRSPHNKSWRRRW